MSDLNSSLPSRLNQLYSRHQRWVPIIAFIAGFTFDALVLKRIDELKVILQQAVYLILSATFVGLELIEKTRELHPPRILAKIWKYREAVLHFILGTLLNCYTIFYFKSASAFTSIFFIVLLVGLLTVHEFKRFGESQVKVHAAFLSLCLISFLISLVPTIMGFIGSIPFLIALGISVALLMLYLAILKPKLGAQPELLRSHILLPYAVIQSLFVVLYFLHAIPPVPLSVKYLGIFHGAQKTANGYELEYTRPEWKFWQHGDQTYLARPGDVIYCYAQIFSPTHFKDELQVRWLYWEPRRGWQTSDAIPLPVVGGRDEGYRAITKKSNFQPGAWRVQIETTESQEVGRIDFSVESEPADSEREIHVQLKN